MNVQHPHLSTLAAWQRDRFGMSLHFGLYSVAARGEWVRSVEELHIEEYRHYFEAFNPDPGWAAEWARLAARAGARYAVLTTKHHDGFCLFDSALTSYKATNAAAGRDLVREWVDAVRAEGLKVGFYYSLVDWHHPDCPAAGDRQHPLRHKADSPARNAQCDWNRYVAYLHGQVEELCTLYGRIDSLVFDFSYWEYTGEKWGATELLRKIRSLQPHCLVNDRLGNEPGKRVPRPSFAGDYEQTEQNIPREGLRDDAGMPMPWEGWFTLNNSWCYSTTDHCWKTPTAVIRALVNCVSKNGNLLLNVSPDARGRVPAQARGILEELGRWLALNGESIYGAGASEFPKPEWGRYTQREGVLYAHLLDPVIGNITLHGLRGRVKNGRLPATGAEVLLCDFWNPGVQTFDGPEDIFFNFARPTSATYPLPDAHDTVVAFDLATDAEREAELRRLAGEKSRLLLERKPY